MNEPTSSNSKMRKLRPILIGIASIIFGAVIGAGIIWALMVPSKPVVTPPIVTPEPVNTAPIVTPEPEPVTPGINYVTDTRALRLTVDWQTPKQQNVSDVFIQGSAAGQRFLNLPKTGEDAYIGIQDERGWWLRGTISAGELKGYKLYRTVVYEEGMGTVYTPVPLLVSPDRTRCTLVGISPDTGSATVYVLKDICTYAPKMTLANVNDPAPTVTIPGKGDIDFTRKTADYADDFGDCTATVCAHENLKIMAKASDGRPVYEGAGELWSGTNLLMFNAFGDQFRYTQIKNESVIWDSAYQNLKNFTYVVPSGGCGVTPDVMVMQGEDAKGINTADLVKAGVTESGKIVYVPKDPANNPQMVASYDGWMEYTQEGTKPSMQEFLKKYPQPAYFRQDIFGRWIKFQITQVQPVAECGKPVIYLYPTKTENVSVKLPAFIQVTKSEPSYPAKGWTVTAHPDGTLDYADGKQYGSLFWEGIGVDYKTPAQGFIVKDGEVDAFLTRVLAEYGLNERESAEFREFWVPLMTGAPYYRVSFLTDDWSKAAPLSVNPKPDTSIRIFMDWRKLGAPQSIVQPTIVTPVRQGFTLVEWGGILWK